MFGENMGEARILLFVVEDVSVEFCGGTHVKTQQILSFYIIKESGGAGIRRIEAVGEQVYLNIQNKLNKLMNQARD